MVLYEGLVLCMFCFVIYSVLGCYYEVVLLKIVIWKFCLVCYGICLNKKVLIVKIVGKNIVEVSDMDLVSVLKFLDNILDFKVKIMVCELYSKI